MQDNGILVSFVVPVYNVEKYLNECLDSIFDPSVDDSLYEVIAVNDGSTDNSPAILETYKKYENFRLYNQDNQGPSVARNIGIERARGKFIFFVDSDDYLLPGAIETALCYAASSECEIVKFDFIEWYESTGKFEDAKEETKHNLGVIDGKEAFIRGYGPNSVAKLLRRDYLLNHKLFFYPGVLFEDFEWTPRLFYYAKRVDSPNEELYFRRVRPGSIMTSLKDKQTCLDYLKIAEMLEEFRDTIAFSPDNLKFRRKLGDVISQLVKGNLRRMYRHVPPNERQEILEKLKKCRHLLGLTSKPKGKLRYYLTRRLPDKIAFWVYSLSR